MTENEAKNFHANTDMFGRYAKIPTGRSGDLHIYKIITRFHSNGYCDVPIIGLDDSTFHEEITDVLNVIHCGVDESKVIRVALKDCEIIENEEAKELWKYRKIGTVKECREAMEKQIPKKPRDIEYDYSYFICDNCGAAIYAGDEFDGHHYCLNCGQAIEWPDRNLEGTEDE